MPRDLILGTAGHIDHGKTALVKALTGIDCDRLPEEKARGITIDIGFARLDLGDYRLGIVDVPGHERFIKNMLAGATGIDLVVLIVAADDSVMPQTREHLEILRLLGLRHGVLALTKCDLVDETTREVVELEVRELVQGTFLENAPLIRTSAHTGEGIPELKATLAAICAQIDQRTGEEWFRMSIDRSFIVQGHGTVVTGSVTSGRLRVGDEVEWQPRGERVRVRSLQNHDQAVEDVHRGMRAAINLAGVHHEDVVRGQEVATPGYLVPSRTLTVRLHCLSDVKRPIKHRAPARFHIGTAEVMGTVSLLDADAVQPGAWALAQVFLEEPVMAVWGQPFVLRGSSATQTLGGGQVLQPVAKKVRRRHVEMLERIEKLWTGNADERALTVAWFGGFGGFTAADLVRGANVGPDQAGAVIERLKEQKALVDVSLGSGRHRLLHADMIRELDERILTVLSRLHQEFPLMTSHDRQKVQSQLDYIGDDTLVHAAVDRLLTQKRLVGDLRRVARADFKPKLSANLRKLKDRLVADFQQARFTPPEPSSFAGAAGGNAANLKDLFDVCVAEGFLVHIAGELYLHSEAEAEMRRLVTQKLTEGAGLTVAEIRDLLGTTRKFAVPLCEYLDRAGVTRRAATCVCCRQREYEARRMATRSIRQHWRAYCSRPRLNQTLKRGKIMDTSESSHPLSCSAAEQLLDFQVAWQEYIEAIQGGVEKIRPDIRDACDKAEPAEREYLFPRLLRAECEARLRLGEKPITEEYHQRFPGREVAIRDEIHRTLPPNAADGATPRPAAGLLPQVTGYEILSELGRGGMGVVYQARHTKLGRVVALKMIRSGTHPQEDELARFRTEAEAIARLQLPNIVQVFEVGDHEGLPFFSLEFCGGGSLEKQLAGTPLSPRKAAALVETLARAMQEAHDNGVIHRDLKPANVLFAADGTPKITDFGLAKKLDEAGQTQPGAIIGTPSYMAPEQAQGRNDEVGPAADVYALGAVLYECLTGWPPFKADTVWDTVRQVIQDEPVSPSRLQPGLPRDLETICLKCLKKQPDKRYNRADALADDLKRFLAGEPIQARPTGSAERMLKWVRRRRAITALVATIVLVVIAGSLGGWLWVRQSDQRERDLRDIERKEFENVRTSLRQSLAAFDVARLTLGPGKGHDLLALQKELAEKVPLYETIILHFPEDEALRTELATIYRRLSWIDGLYGDGDKAIALTEKARALWTELGTAHADAPFFEAELADIYSDLGTLHSLRRQWDEAQEAYQEGIRRRERLQAMDAGSTDQELQLALDWLALGELHRARGNVAEADVAFAKASQVQRQHPAIDAGHPRQVSASSSYFFQRALALAGFGRDEAAAEAFREALACLDEICQPGAAEPQVVIGAALAAKDASDPEGPHPVSTLRSLIQSALPQDTFRNAIEFHARMAKEHPDEPAYTQRLARSCFYLMAMTFSSKGAAGAEEALVLARQGTEAYHELLKARSTNGDCSLKEAQLCYVTGSSLLLLPGWQDQAKDWCAKALAVLDTATLGEEQQLAARVIRRDAFLVRAIVLANQNHHLAALTDFSRAFEIDPTSRKGVHGNYYAVIVAAARRQMIVERLRKERYLEATADADALARIPEIPGEALYDGACVFALASAAEKDAAPREKYAARSVELLRLAFAAGFGKDPIQKTSGILGDPVKHMERDKDLTTLRDRDDYKKLLADLSGKP